jgi:hypothetical protein
MPTSATPDVLTALLALARTDGVLPEGRLVLDGWEPVRSRHQHWLIIGAEDPTPDASITSADAQQEWAHVSHTTRDETGTITCVALSWNGESDLPKARADAYATTAALETAIRADYTLGLPTVLWTSFGGTSRLVQTYDNDGAEVAVVFTIGFRARI